jgi:hypothetical protein
MIFDRLSIQILGEWPESIQMNFITESRGKCIHEETCAWSFDGDFVCQPVTRRRKKKKQKNLEKHKTYPAASTLCRKFNCISMTNILKYY